jgi:hypothetical protein
MQGRDFISLSELFSERQLVPCVVTSLDVSDSKEQQKRSKRIGLSLRLSNLHKGLTIDSIHEGLVSFLVLKGKETCADTSGVFEQVKRQSNLCLGFIL